MPPLEAIPLAGTLDCWTGDFDVPELLLAVCATGKTGRLELVTAEAEKKVFLQDGRIVFASSSSDDDRLGAYLFLRNELSLKDLRRMSLLVEPGVRLGTILVRHGILPPEKLVQAVLGQVRAIVLGLFQWPQASYRFVEGKSSKDEVITLAIPSARWILDGIDSVSSWRRVSRGLGSLEARYAVVAGNEASLRSLDLDTASLELLALLRHPRALEEVCGSSVLADIAVCRRLWAFLLLGWVRPAPEKAGFGDADAALDSDLEGLGMILTEEPGEPQE